MFKSTGRPESAQKFAVVHIPSAMPAMAMIAWVLMTRNPTPAKALENMWFSQMDVSDDLKARQKAWERDLWNNKISKGSAAYKEEGFHEDWWAVKSMDRYKFLIPVRGAKKMSYTVETREGLSEQDVADYISVVLSSK